MPKDWIRNLDALGLGGKEEEATFAGLIRPDKEMRYVSLHHHSTFSYQDGFAMPKSHVHRAAELGMPALALTEHGNVSSHGKLEAACAEYGVKAIYGCELYCGEVDQDKRTQRKNHLTVLAANEVGYRNLLHVVSQGWSNFYYEPTVDGHTLAERRDGLIILSGCTGSLLSTSLTGGKNIPKEEASYQRAKETALRFKRVFGDAYYLEVQMFPELANVCTINQAWERMSRETGIPLVATGDCHYTKPEESELQQVLHAIGRHKSLEQLAQAWSYDVSLAPPLTDKMVYDKLRATGLSHRAAEEAIANTAIIASRCNASVPHMDPIRFPIPPGFKDRDEFWRHSLNEGWRFRNFAGRTNVDAEGRTYKERIEYEKGIIEHKDFVDYFLFTSDIVKFAKDSGIAVGPGRGSAAGSLICYALRITEVDPMLFDNLIFERFIDITREDLPDIDLDFEDERRPEVFEYAARKYGREFVGRIGTVNKFKSKNSLDDVAKVHHIPQWKVDKVKEVLLERSSGDLRASATIEDTVEQFDQAREVFEEHPELWMATRLEGNVKSMGIHAAGLVVATRPIRDVCAMYVRTDPKTGEILLDEFGNPREVVSFDKYDAEDHNMLKMDILALANMTIIRIAAEHIGIALQDVYDLPLDDEETIQGFRENDCVGIFQFDGWAMRSVNGSLKPDNFDEVADVNALARPGPLHSNATGEYVDIKRGIAEPSLTHPMLDPIVKNTRGQIVYQEQILRIVREIGQFDWTHAAYIRKIISRKIGEQEFNRQFAKFQEGARAQGLDDETIDKVWGACITSGSYAFNAAHSVSYGIIAYWTMWLKRHHPAAFFAAALHKLVKGNEWKMRQTALLRDCQRFGRSLTILPPDPAESDVTWRPVDDHTLRAGFKQIPGIGEKMGQAIVEHRAGVLTPLTWDDLLSIKGLGKVTVDKMRSFSEQEDPFDIWTLQRTIERVSNDIRAGRLGRRLPWPTHTVEDVPGDRGKDTEVVWIGTIHSRNVRDLFEINNSRGTPLTPEEVKSPELSEWIILYGQDHTDQMSITVDRFKYPRFKKMVWSIELDSDLVLVRGVKKGYQARRALYVQDMWVIDPTE